MDYGRFEQIPGDSGFFVLHTALTLDYFPTIIAWADGQGFDHATTGATRNLLDAEGKPIQDRNEQPVTGTALFFRKKPAASN